jgi:hypothetical protein
MEFADRTAELPSSQATAGLMRRHGKQTAGVLVALAQEAHDTALLVAATGSIVNAIVSCKRPQLRTCMATYLPTPPTLFPISIGADGANSTLPTQTIQGLIAFYSVIAFARSATLSYSAKREPGGVTGPISMETLGEAWQSAAMHGIGTLTQLGFLDTSSVLFEGGRDNSAVMRLVEMLWGVTVGRSPCVRIDGAIIVPGWIERRAHLRREINAPGTMLWNGKRRNIMVRDLSASGIGIEGGEGVVPGDNVSVSLGTSMKFDGVAVWNNDGRVGIKLATPNRSPISED